jgi:hypothetical protein
MAGSSTSSSDREVFDELHELVRKQSQKEAG